MLLIATQYKWNNVWEDVFFRDTVAHLKMYLFCQQSDRKTTDTNNQKMLNIAPGLPLLQKILYTQSAQIHWNWDDTDMCPALVWTSRVFGIVQNMQIFAKIKNGRIFKYYEFNNDVNLKGLKYELKYELLIHLTYQNHIHDLRRKFNQSNTDQLSPPLSEGNLYFQHNPPVLQFHPSHRGNHWTNNKSTK